MTDEAVIQFVDSLENNSFAVLFNEENIEDFVNRAIELYPHKPSYKFHALLNR